MSHLADKIIYGTDEDILKEIEGGADVNARDEYGFKPLIQAIICKKTNVINWLLDAGADIEQLDIIGRTPLQWASDRNEYEICKHLLEKGANPNHSSIDGQPILVNPILREQRELVELLVEFGAKYQFAQDFISAKLIGHRFELTGEADIVNPENAFIPLSFEGFYLEFTCGLIQRSLNNFTNSIPGQKYEMHKAKFSKMKKALTNASYLAEFKKQKDKTPFEPTIDKILANDLLVLPVGYQGHAITFVSYGKYFAKCDRGVNSFTDTVIIYEMTNPLLLNKQFCYELLFEAKTDEFIDISIKEILGLKAINTLPTKSQIAGNCSWANVEAAVPAMMFMLSAKNNLKRNEKTGVLKKSIIAFYNNWVEWDKDSSLEEAIEDFFNANDLRKISKATILGSILIQRCHPKKKRDVNRAKSILKILTMPEYSFLLENYIRLYTSPKTGSVGRNIITLFKLCGLDFKSLTLAGVKSLPNADNSTNEQKVRMTTALHVACLNGDIVAAKYLLDKAKIDVNYQDRTGSTALMYAAWKGHNEIVKLLVEKYNADKTVVNTKGGTAARYAAYAMHSDIVEYLKA